METSQLPNQKPVVDIPPPTVEYVETKRNWKKTIEIVAVVLIIVVPLLLSLFKFDYTVKRVYEVVNPAYIGTSADYGTWGGIITTAKKFIQPIINTKEQPTPTPAAAQNPTSQSTQGSSGQPSESSQQSPSRSNQESNQNNYQNTYPAYPQQSQDQAGTDTPTATPPPVQNNFFFHSSQSNTTQNVTSEPTATLTPTLTPIPTPTPNQQNSQQIDAYASYMACYGKKYGASCSYVSSYGDTIDGKCRNSAEYNNYLMCMQH